MHYLAQAALTLGLSAALASPALSDQVYKCVDEKGNISFTHNPFCPGVQAYAKNRNEPLVQVNPASIATISPAEKIELYYDRVDLADLMETIGDVAGIPVETIGIEGSFIRVHQPPRSWINIFNELVLEHNLDYRQAYGRVYLYRLGTMGETIVHNSDLLRWYQAATTWDVVLKHDSYMLAMKAYEDSTLADRLPNLLKRVRGELGEKAHSNAAEVVALKETSTMGVGGAIAAARSQEEIASNRMAQEDEKRRRIIQRRQSNSEQRAQNSQGRCFSSGQGC